MTVPISVVCTCEQCGKEDVQPVITTIQAGPRAINGRLPINWIRVDTALWEVNNHRVVDTRVFCSFACVGAWYASLDDPPRAEL